MDQHWHVLFNNWYLHWSNPMRLNGYQGFFYRKAHRLLLKVFVTEKSLSFWKTFYPKKITSYIPSKCLNVLHSTMMVLTWGLQLQAINQISTLLILKIFIFHGPGYILCLEFTRSIYKNVFLLNFLEINRESCYIQMAVWRTTESRTNLG